MTMRTTRIVRRGLPGIGLVIAACSGTPSTEDAGPSAAPPPPVIESFQRDRPVFHVPDPDGRNDYFIYAVPQGRLVKTVEAGVGMRAATPEESRFALDRYEALRRLNPQAQADAYVALKRAEQAAKGDIDDELVALMRRSIRQWEEEKRNLEIKQEAARVAGVKEEEAQLSLMINDLDRRIVAHEIKLRLCTSPEWKARRPQPRPEPTLRAADAPK
jgi:hypothetical protein